MNQCLDWLRSPSCRSKQLCLVLLMEISQWLDVWLVAVHTFPKLSQTAFNTSSVVYMVSNIVLIQSQYLDPPVAMLCYSTIITKLRPWANNSGASHTRWREGIRGKLSIWTNGWSRQDIIRGQQASPWKMIGPSLIGKRQDLEINASSMHSETGW